MLNKLKSDLELLMQVMHRLQLANDPSLLVSRVWLHQSFKASRITVVWHGRLVILMETRPPEYTVIFEVLKGTAF